MTDDKGVQPEGSSDEKSSRQGRLLALSVALLLLVLCLFVSISYTSFFRPLQERARFVVLNRTCLQCHLEVLPQLRLAYQHNPFLKLRCTECHTPHYGPTTKPGKSGGGRVEGNRCGLFFGLAVAAQRQSAPASAPAASGAGQTYGGSDAAAKRVRPSGLAPSVLTRRESILCTMCHGGMKGTSSKYQHQPFQAGHCTSCHNPHASAYSRLIKTTPERLCTSCHRIKEQLDLPNVHPPFGEHRCMDCHSPHGSNQKGMLIESQRTLCLVCHPNVAKLVNMPVQHAPFANGGCTGCHKPHSSRVVKLLEDREPVLCYKCHDTIRMDFLKPSHHPVGTVLLVCSDCHQPHAAFYPRLLVAKDNLLCFTCHGDKRSYYEPSKHNTVRKYAGTGLCINCHTPHGSGNRPLLLDEELSLCFSCHRRKGFTHPYGHPVGDPYKDKHNGDVRLTCTTSCHNPHGTQNTKMLITLPDGLCLYCHESKDLP